MLLDDPGRSISKEGLRCPCHNFGDEFVWGSVERLHDREGGTGQELDLIFQEKKTITFKETVTEIVTVIVTVTVTVTQSQSMSMSKSKSQSQSQS